MYSLNSIYDVVLSIKSHMSMHRQDKEEQEEQDRLYGKLDGREATGCPADNREEAKAENSKSVSRNKMTEDMALRMINADRAQALLRDVKSARTMEQGVLRKRNARRPDQLEFQNYGASGSGAVNAASMDGSVSDWRAMSTTFVGDKSLEVAYVIWVSQNNRGCSLRIHSLLTVAWLVGWLKSLYMLSRGQGNGGATKLCALLLVQSCILVHQMVQLRRLGLTDYISQARHEIVKTKIHMLLHFGTMAVVILSAKTMIDSPSHAIVLTFLTCIAIADMLPLRQLVRLHAVRLFCFLAFVIMDVYGVFAQELPVQYVVKDIALVAIFGTLLPMWFALSVERRQRIQFLTECNVPLEHLGEFWPRVSRFV